MMKMINSPLTVLLLVAQLVLSGRSLTASTGPENFFYHKFLNETRNKESKCMINKWVGGMFFFFL